MNNLLILFISLLIIPSVWLLYKTYKRKKRQSIFNRPFPDEWKKIISQHVPMHSILPNKLKCELYGKINIFIDEKVFVGCAGIEITDEIKVTIAAHACVLLLNRQSSCYPNFKTILVYPSAYIAKNTRHDGVIQTNNHNIRLGEAWKRGPLVLAWDAVLHGAHDIHDGHNVVLHEFAHKLDFEESAGAGVPILRSASHYVSWARIMSKEFERLQKKIKTRKKTVLDPYGATNAAEFFAVLTETFFEKPIQLKQKHPELYKEVMAFYQVDPASWKTESSQPK